MDIQRLFIYPIKSLLPVEVSSVKLTNAGLAYDRSFVLIKDPQDTTATTAEHHTIKTTSKLCLFHQAIDWSGFTLTIAHRLHDDRLTLPLCPTTDDLTGTRVFEVTIFGSTATGFDMGTEAAEYFSRHLNQPARLLYIGENGSRDIAAKAFIPRLPQLFSFVRGEAFHPQRIRFMDGAPILVTTTASEEDAVERLPKDARDEDVVTRFRSNIHVNTKGLAGAYDEDEWTEVVIEGDEQVKLNLVFSTPRCRSLNVDFETGGVVASERQSCKLLLRDRKVNPMLKEKPCFGRYAFSAPEGVVISVGDRVRVR